MVFKTCGIVISSVKFSETSLIVKIYTKAFGLQTYIIKGARTAGKRGKSHFFQPLNMLDLEVYRREHKQINHVKEFSLMHVYRSIPFDILKSSVALFLSEMLGKTLHEEERNETLFDFMESSLLELDECAQWDANFHLRFLVKLSRHLGFFPGGRFSESSPYFDLREGLFVSEIPAHPHYIKPPLSKMFHALAGEGACIMNQSGRNEMLEKILLYYSLHVSGFGKIKSHKVLHEVLEFQPTETAR